MYSQISRRLVPMLGQATHNMTDFLPRLMFTGFNVTTRNNCGSTNLIAVRSIGSFVSHPSAAAPTIGWGGHMSNLGTRTALFPAAATNLVTKKVMVGTSSTSSHHQARGFASKKHRRVIKLSKGFRGRANRCFRVAIRRLEKSWQYAYRDRKVKKREFRKLWIQRLNAGVRQQGLSYSKFIEMEGRSGVKLDRKILSGLAMYEPFSFKAVVDVVKKVSTESGAKQ